MSVISFADVKTELEAALIQTIETTLKSRDLPFDLDSLLRQGSASIEDLATEAVVFGADLWPALAA